jgi:hypothetical protein
MENFLYGIGVGIVITIVSLILISYWIAKPTKGNDREWEA